MLHVWRRWHAERFLLLDPIIVLMPLYRQPPCPYRVADVPSNSRVGVPLQHSHTPTSLVERFGAAGVDSSVRVVHIAAVSCGENITGVLNLVKSATIFSYKEALHFHIFSDTASEGALHKQVCVTV